MQNQKNGNGEQDGKIVRRETFSDGSQILELENGSMLLLEGKGSKTLAFAEQPAPYDEPAPEPKAAYKATDTNLRSSPRPAPDDSLS